MRTAWENPPVDGKPDGVVGGGCGRRHGGGGVVGCGVVGGWAWQNPTVGWAAAA